MEQWKLALIRHCLCDFSFLNDPNSKCARRRQVNGQRKYDDTWKSTSSHQLAVSQQLGPVRFTALSANRLVSTVITFLFMLCAELSRSVIVAVTSSILCTCNV